MSVINKLVTTRVTRAQIGTSGCIESVLLQCRVGAVAVVAGTGVRVRALFDVPDME